MYQLTNSMSWTLNFHALILRVQKSMPYLEFYVCAVLFKKQTRDVMFFYFPIEMLNLLS